MNLTPRPGIEKAMDELFRDHDELSDFIMKKQGIQLSLEDMAKEARSGQSGPNTEHVIWLRKFLEAMRYELQELDDDIPWKWWRPVQANMQNARVELVDIFHFLVSACRAAGMTGSDFVNLYYQKRQLNFDRQEVGFHEGDNKKIVV